MKIKEISIEHFKSLYNLDIKDITDINVFVGKNNSGKSNIFEAVNIFYREITRTDEELPTLFIESRVKPTEVSTGIGFLFEIDNLNDELNQSHFDESFDECIKKEIEYDGSSGIYSTLAEIRGFPKYLSFYDIFVAVVVSGLVELRSRFCLQSWDPAQFSNFLVQLTERPYPNELKNSLNSVKYLKLYYSFDSSLGPGYRISLLDREKVELMNLSEIIAIQTNPRSLPFIYHDFDWDFSHVLGMDLFKTIGFDSRFRMEEEKIESVLHKIMTQNPSKLSQIKEEVNKITGANITEIKLQEGSLFFSFNNGNGLVPFHNLGIGTRRILQIVSKCLYYDNGKIIFIEEPELHLHPHAQRKLFEFIKQLAKHHQFFINTHSTIFTGHSKNLSTYLVTNLNQATTVTQIKEKEQLKSIKHELGAKHIDLYFDDCIVIVEGDTEEKALPIIAEALGYDFKDEGIRIINIKGNSRAKAKKIREFLEYMKNSDVISYVILDGGDRGVSKTIDDLIRNGLIERENYTKWEKTFVDCFGECQIIQAMEALSKEYNFKFDLTEDDLRQKRKNGMNTEIILEKSLSDSNLDKIELGEKLGLITENEIIKEVERDKTEPEKVVEKIIQIVRNK